ncbi:MAG: xanthine dehydrogenase small subunit [Rhodocyclaceae bacterium]
MNPTTPAEPVTRPIQFYFRGGVRHVAGVSPTRTVLQYLREDLHQCGTKEGCAEGDCGACTVVVGELIDDALQLRAVNACIQFLPTLDGKALFTVEDLAGQGGATLHPVQQAMVDCHGSQCGFCTPGFVMSLWAMYENEPTCPPREEVADVLSGNLCRCTGYRPIFDAARVAYEQPRVTMDRAAVIGALRTMGAAPALAYESHGQRFWAPRDLNTLGRLRAEYPQATLLAGSTDVGLWVTKQLRELAEIIYTGAVDALRHIQIDDGWLEIGAAASLTDAFVVMTSDEPMWTELARRFASTPVRNAGTLGGNVANGSPIGDSMPGLIALGARVVLQHGAVRRDMPLEDFYLAYRRTALQEGEFVAAVRIPRRQSDDSRLFRIWKVSKRADQDIAAVCGAFALTLRNGIVEDVRIAFGGMAATPCRAVGAEHALKGHAWTEAAVRSAQAALAEDFAPLSDMRASAAYRRTVAANLLERLWLSTQGAGAALRVEELADA